MTPVSKNVDINKLADIVNKHSNTYHIRIKMKPTDVRSNNYIDLNPIQNGRSSIATPYQFFSRSFYKC